MNQQLRVWPWMTHVVSHRFSKHFTSVLSTFHTLPSNKSHKLFIYNLEQLLLKLDSISSTWHPQMSVLLWTKGAWLSKSKIKTFQRQLSVCTAKHHKLISQRGYKKDGEAGGRLLSPASILTLGPLAHLHHDSSIQPRAGAQATALCVTYSLHCHLKHQGKERT